MTSFNVAAATTESELPGFKNVEYQPLSGITAGGVHKIDTPSVDRISVVATPNPYRFSPNDRALLL